MLKEKPILADYDSSLIAFESYEADLTELINDPSIATEAENAAPAATQPANAPQQLNAVSTSGREQAQRDGRPILDENTNSKGSTNTTNDNKNNTKDITSEVNDAKNATKDTAKENNNLEENKDANPADKAKQKEKIQKIMSKIQEILEGCIRALQNRLRLMLETDNGFRRQYYKLKSTTQPEPKVSVTSYAYKNDILDGTMQRVLMRCKGAVAQLIVDIYAQINASSSFSPPADQEAVAVARANQADMIPMLYKGFGDAKNTQEFVRYILNEYRGEKAQFTYSANDIPNIEKNAMRTKDISIRTNQFMSSIKDGREAVRKAIQYVKSQNLTDDQLKTISTLSAKNSLLYNTYTALVNNYFELRLEQSLNYRVILKKFYHI